MRYAGLSVLILAGAVLAACYSKTTLAIPEPGTQLKGNPEVVSVIRHDRSVITVYKPTIENDSLVGWLDRPQPAQPPISHIAISLADVQQISTRQVDAKRTGVGVATGVVLVGILALVAFVALLDAIAADGGWY